MVLTFSSIDHHLRMHTIQTSLAAVRQRIREAEQRFQRPAGSVQLLAVSKTRSVEEIREAACLGQLRFGESYLKEALGKVSAPGLADLEWHFIGPVQSNKTTPIAQRFSWVHSLDRARIAVRLNAARPVDLPPLNVCIQVNISGEASKSGTEPSEILALAEYIRDLPRLALRGIMSMPALSDDFSRQRAAFRQLYRHYLELVDLGFPLDTLSMGTSADLEAAIAEGSTLVRVGTDIFGPR